MLAAAAVSAIGIVLPPPVRAALGIPPGAALAVFAVWPMRGGTHRGLWVGELGQTDGRRWPVVDVLVAEVDEWIAAAKC